MIARDNRKLMEKMTEIIKGKGKKPLATPAMHLARSLNERERREYVSRVNLDNKVSGRAARLEVCDRPGPLFCLHSGVDLLHWDAVVSTVWTPGPFADRGDRLRGRVCQWLSALVTVVRLLSYPRWSCVVVVQIMLDRLKKQTAYIDVQQMVSQPDLPRSHARHGRCPILT
jgi:hypothetical protein